ncbi:transmembrane protein, putative [Bodo saltans]|uniref:Transmembrane protein, putative n=1 Tax=Bodo saltans TaxID=75058 RepID=A0A0S4JHX1_BODSA|nr:transmembrane protein, putative [Bodo saltans]|eukprot:CUG88641.1 transmembrane protein, putative [Bodo saltans]
MFNRIANGEALRAEGHLRGDEPKEHKMTFYSTFKDRHRNTEGRPVVDVSVPFNAMDETHKGRMFGVAKGVVSFLSMNHFTGLKEQVPYTDSHHTFELSCLTTFGIQICWINHYMGKTGVGNVPMNNPHLYFATSLATYIGFMRCLVAGAVASFGYFYVYEYLYTYVPGFKIKDPSHNGWQRAFDEGQSTYMARIVASAFPALGYILFSRRLKRSSNVFLITAGVSVQYEYARSQVFPGTRLFYNVQAEKWLSKEANMGSLAGDMRRKDDVDTNKTKAAGQFRYTRMTAGMLQDIIWENATHETRPGSQTSYKVDNPWYNWQKAPQAYNEAPIRVKNDLWKMPSVLNARNMSGALDAR